MNRSIKLICLLAGIMLVSSASAQSASAKSTTAKPNNTSNQGIQGAKTRIENVTNYGAVKSTNTYTVNKSTDAAQVAKQQQAVENKHQQEVAKKYPATGKPVPAPGK